MNLCMSQLEKIVYFEQVFTGFRTFLLALMKNENGLSAERLKHSKISSKLLNTIQYLFFKHYVSFNQSQLNITNFS